MNTREKLISARVGMLALADELKSISRACQIAGISGTHVDEIRTAFQEDGGDALAPKERPPRRPTSPRRRASSSSRWCSMR